MDTNDSRNDTNATEGLGRILPKVDWERLAGIDGDHFISAGIPSPWVRALADAIEAKKKAEQEGQ